MDFGSPRISHPWQVSDAEAKKIQTSLAKRVISEDYPGPVRYIAGVDVAYHAHPDDQIAAAVVLKAESLEIVDFALAREALTSPYVPGLFSFRELPTIIKALKALKTVPDMIVCDGQGVAHPRRFGLASHLGVMFDIPTIGCGKTKLIGEAEEPGPIRGDRTFLKDGGDIIGSVLRTQDRIKPVYVSVGHLISLETACDWILRLTPRYRLPETTRMADQMVRAAMKDLKLSKG